VEGCAEKSHLLHILHPDDPVVELLGLANKGLNQIPKPFHLMDKVNFLVDN